MKRNMLLTLLANGFHCKKFEHVRGCFLIVVRASNSMAMTHVLKFFAVQAGKKIKRRVNAQVVPSVRPSVRPSDNPSFIVSPLFIYLSFMRFPPTHFFYNRTIF
jgi:hypothetical protein